jgi:hypothetical protein
MSLAADLRTQARQLARQEPRRPRQASLRRAVSAAYYALFHLLVADATRSLVGGAAPLIPLRHGLSRAFNHGPMAQACKSFARGLVPPALAKAVPASGIGTDLRVVAETFTLLQAERHRADYDLAAVYFRADVFKVLEQLDDAWDAWCRVRDSQEACLFLVALAFWPGLQR